MTVTYTLPKPPALSSCFRNANGPGRVKTQRYKTWERAAGNELIAQGRVMFPGQVRLTMAVPYRANSDLDNYWKATKDLLKSMRVIVDDSMKFCVDDRAVVTDGPFTITVEAVDANG